ncbi:hypothetical protein PBV87_21415 [Niameybacter massiliensis]|uniref:Uncharacterized protein n=1 Tax=Holtiella tumoricola TaxID=3018743 RepID=A0AA42DW29_9FIRM|nr:hypothetical protein [Holtiella tumoricola]MDA3734037.1 hypothetical protein [Holtiella tumoricola]
MEVTKILKEKLMIQEGKAQIKMLKKNKRFNIQLVEEGILVDNLRNYPLLEWKVFEKAIELLKDNNGCVQKGNAMGYKLGDGMLSVDSLEGYIAKEVYGKSIGDSVFRRVSPIVNILVWAEVCENGKGVLKLKKNG